MGEKRALTWVGHHQHDTVGAVLYNVGNNKLKDVDIPLHQVQSALSLLLAGPCGHHNHLRVGGHAIVWNTHRTYFSLHLARHAKFNFAFNGSV